MPETSSASPTLKLLVLKTPQLDRMRQFYEALGLSLRAEQHGGPLHYSAQLGDTILEVYPAAAGAQVDKSTRLGFSVQDLPLTMRRLAELDATVVAAPKQTPWGTLAVVRDPDGRAVEVHEKA